MKNSLLVHQHLIIRAEAIKPPTDEEQLTEWMKDFVESINMKIFMGPYVKYCNMEGKPRHHCCCNYRNFTHSNACMGRTIILH